MKYLIASDIHGCLPAAEKIIQRFKAEKPHRLVLLGDLYYHGPRNPLPEGYDSMAVANLFNQYEKVIIAVRGNCDSEADQMVSRFKMRQHYKIKTKRKTTLCTHGHRFNSANPPEADFDILIYGHEHTGYIMGGSRIFANAGSVALPKNNTPPSYIMLETKRIILKDLDGGVIAEWRI